MTASVGNLVAAANGGRIIAFSSEDPNGEWAASHLIDGQNDTAEGWSSEDTDDEYIVFALRGGWTHIVERVVLNPYSDGYEEDWIRDFELRASETETDPQKMRRIGRFRLEQAGEDQTFTFAPTPARYLALIPRSNYGGSAFGLNEFEVYGSGVGSIAPAVIRGQPPQRQAEVADLPTVELPTRFPPATSAPVTGPAGHRIATAAGSPLDRVDVDVTIYDIVPVIYHLYGSYMEDLAEVTLTNRNPDPVKVRVAVVVDSYTETGVKTVTLAPGETASVKQSPPLIPSALEGLHGMRRASLHIVVDYLKEGERRLIYEDTSPITIYAREDFPWNIPGFYNGTHFLATMVTPNDPAVEELLRRAADRIPGGIITFGYGEEDDGDHKTWNRVKAIYETLAEDYDLIYVATGVSFVPQEQMAEGFSLQRLLLPYEVLAARGGMCVELSTLFASALEKLLLRPILITIPGHVYVGLPISWDSHIYYFLETTLIGRASFETAVQVGNQQFMKEPLEPIEEDRLDNYFWLDISEARAEGILPIPWR
ncbi:MAG: discoidin domain-containing protein [Anaerolineae bacterium]|nr:discoidin domain-containing protein [Anaerolineae bacterium]